MASDSVKKEGIQNEVLDLLTEFNYIVDTNVCSDTEKVAFIHDLVDVIVEVDVARSNYSLDSLDRKALDQFRNKLDDVTHNILRENLASLKLQLDCKLVQ
jgi:hypothetical protein